MGFRFGKSIKLGKFVRLNVSRSGIGVSAGVKGARISTGPRGTNATASLPGTGISYTQRLDGGSKSSPAKSTKAAKGKQSAPPPSLPKFPAPGLFAPGHEKEFVKALNDYVNGKADDALGHFRKAAQKEPCAALMAALILAKRDGHEKEAIGLLEGVVQGDSEFPTPLMNKYRIIDSSFGIDITPNVKATVPMDGLGAALLLAELYQEEERTEEAIGLLEELEELAGEPVLTLSLCELYASMGLWEGVVEKAGRIEVEDDVTLETMLLRGRALQELGLHDAAVKVFTDSVRKKKDRSPELLREAAYWRAVSYQELGKKAQASKEFQNIYADAPRFRDVAKRLKALQA